jgi:HK97 family phage portal protein
LLAAISSFIKRMTSREYAQTTVGVLSDKPTPPPFSAAGGLAAYGSWVAAAASLNANAVASTPIRLYARERKGAKALWPVRPVSRLRKRYLHGDLERRPHRCVTTKAAAFGDDFVEVIDHPILQLFYKVNPWMCGFEFLSLMGLHLELTGNAYAFMPKGKAGVPQEVWLIPPESMYVVPGAGNWIKGYEYRPRYGGESTMFEPEEIAHFKLPNPRSLWYGMGGVEKMWWAINANAAAVRHDFAMYENNARPDYAVIVKQGAPSEEALDRYQANINKKLRGAAKRGGFLAMSGDVEIRPLQFPPKDMMGREDLVEEIAAAFSVPITLLKGNDPNRANAEVGYASWREMAVATRCRLIEDVLNQNVLPLFDVGEDAVLAFDDPVPGNSERDSVVADRYLRAGVRTINEVREELGDEPAEDEYADKLLFNGQPLGASPLSAMGSTSPMGEIGSDSEAQDEAPPTRDLAGTAGDPNAAVQDTALNGAQVQSLLELAVQVRQGIIPPESAVAISTAAFPLIPPETIAAIFNPIASAPPLPEPEPAPAPAAKPEAPTKAACGCGTKHVERVSQRKMWAKASDDDTVRDESDKALRSFIDSLTGVLREQAESIVERMRTAGDSPASILLAVQDEVMKPKWTAAIRAAARPYVAAQVEVGAAEGIRQLPRTGDIEPVFEFVNPEVQRYVDRATTRLARTVNETTTIKVSSLLGTRLSEGATIDEMAKDIETTLGVDGSRAEMIARTESAKAYTQGQVEAWKQTDIVVGKRWLLAPDACEFCRAVARSTNETPIPLGAPFVTQGSVIDGVSGGQFVADYEDVDAAPLHPGCRCSVSPVLRGDA